MRAMVATAARLRARQGALSEANLLDVVDDALEQARRAARPIPRSFPRFSSRRLAARHVKVVIGGDGGDELSGGYPTYRRTIAGLARWLPLRTRPVARAVGGLR